MQSSLTFEPTSIGLIFQNDQLLLVKDTSTFNLLNGTQLTTLSPYLQRYFSVGLIQNIPCYCGEINNTAPLPADIQITPLRKALETLGLEWYALIAKAYSIIVWDKNHQFCGRCGTETALTENTFERICPNCKLLLYPRISPCVIVLITKGDEVLMARSPHFTKGAYSVIAGFVEGGETVEEAIHREVKEEVNISVKNLQYFASQAWPFPDSLMLGFIAEYAGGELKPDPREIEDAGWYRYDQLPGLPASPINIARKLINHFLAEKILANTQEEFKS